MNERIIEGRVYCVAFRLLISGMEEAYLMYFEPNQTMRSRTKCICKEPELSLFVVLVVQKDIPVLPHKETEWISRGILKV